MNWLFFALLAPATVSIVVFVDKYLLEKEVKDYRGMPLYGAIMAFIFGTLFWVANSFPTLTPRDTILILVTGLLTTFGSAFYFRVIASEEASNVLILIQLSPIIVLILSVVFLREAITAQQLIGFFLILAGTIGVTLKKQNLALHFSPPFLFMLLAAFCWASSSVLFKFVIDTNSFVKVVSYESWGMAIGGLILYVALPSIRNAFNHTNRSISKKALAVIFINEGVFVASRLFTFLALVTGAVTLVTVLGSTSVFFGILYGLLLMLIAPKIFRESTNRKELVKKLIFAAIVFIGIMLIS